MIRNGDFSEGWNDLEPTDWFLINQEPIGWKLELLDLGGSLYDDPNTQVRGIPECTHKLSEQLPPNEQIGQKNALILAGNATYKIFSANASFGASLSQTVTGLEPGSSVTVTVPIQVHLHGEKDMYGAESGVWLNDEGGWVNGYKMGDRKWYVHVVQTTVPANGEVALVIRMKSKWARPKDFFIDNVTMEGVADDGEINLPPGGEQELSRQTISLSGNSKASKVRLVISERQGEQWVLKQDLTEALQGECQLEIVLLSEAEEEMVSFDLNAKGIDFGAEDISFSSESADVAPLAAPVDLGQRVLGMDVSYAQGLTVNFEKAADMGVKYCFIRAGSGKTERDANYDHNFAEAGRVGMLRGIYYYLYPEATARVGSAADHTPEGQARRFAAMLKPDAELGAVLDVEDTSLTPGDVKRFVDEFKKHDPYKRPLMIYTAAWFWNASRGFSGSSIAWTVDHPLWVAHYTHSTEPIKPATTFKVAIPQPWNTYTFHQWTAVGGALAKQNSMNLDLNYFQGSLSDLQAWAGTDGQVKSIDVKPVGTKYVTAPAGLRMRSEPSATQSVILKTLPWAEPVEVLEEGPWDFIRSGEEEGYASSQFLSTENPLGTGQPAGEFKFDVWPTNDKVVTQKFGEDPEFYKKVSNGFLPGHEGVDLKAPYGSPYFAVAPGMVTRVSDRNFEGKESPYGWHVVVDHGSGYSTLYAHAAPNILVKVGDKVAAGQILAHSGNTGNTSGPHLHLTLKKKGSSLPGWPSEYVDPWPFLEPLFNTIQPPMGGLVEGYLYSRSLDMRGNQIAIAQLDLNMREKPSSDSDLVATVPTGSSVRLLSTTPENGYYRCEASVDIESQPKKVRNKPQEEQIDLLAFVKGDGRQYEVRNSFGGQERFQSQTEGLTFYQVKNSQWEQFFYNNDFIYRDIDTSPGNGRYYRLTDPDSQKGSRWLRRHMAIGDTYTQQRKVQFYKKADGSPSSDNSGDVTDHIKLVAYHPTYKFQTGLEIADVIELHWIENEQDHTAKEKYFYAKGFGMVGWARGHEDPNSPAWSAVSEIHASGTRKELSRERVTIR